MEILIGLLIFYLIYKFLVKPSIAKKAEPDISFRVQYSDSYEKPKGKPAKWIPPGDSITINGHDISDGFIYVGEKLIDLSGYQNDACLINPKSKIKKAEPWEGAESMDYWPRYTEIPPQCRGAYLKWLATGRSEPEAYIGYVFLFFYGLERRIFIDAIAGNVQDDERHAIVKEVRRLVHIYGDNNSFNRYANKFIAMEWALFHQGVPFPDYINLHSFRFSEPFQLLLAHNIAEGKPLTDIMAMQWLHLSPDFSLRTPARRCANEFQTLFKKYFDEKFPDGMTVKPNKRKLDIYFHAASPSLNYNLVLGLPDLPDPFPLKGPLNKINSIAEQCTNALEPYSRYLGRKGNNPKSMAAFSLLPKALLLKRPGFKDTRSKLTKACEKGPILLDVEKFYAGFGEALPMKMNKKESETLAKFMENMGFGIAPDVRFHHSSPIAEGKIVVFEKGHGIDFQPSREYRTISTILRLGAMVSQVDKDISHKEELLLSQLVTDNRELNGIEKDSLLAFLKWCLYTPQGITGIKQRLSALKSEEKIAIGHILISVAHADGRIDPSEIKQLEKLYTQLGLDKSQVTNDLHTLAATSVAHEPVTVAKKDESQSHSIPKPDAEPVVGFSLNEELIRIRHAETQQVKGILEDIFVTEDEDEIVTTESETSTTAINLLDKPHQNLLNQLLQKESWSRDSLHEMCKKLELMVDGAMETINEWAYEQVNAPLIEDGDPLFIDIELAKEIMNE